jgi:hypothetical protein
VLSGVETKGRGDPKETIMEPNGREGGRRDVRIRLLADSEPREQESREENRENDVVFDFTGLHRPDVCDLALILTARLHARPSDRVWVRALPPTTWTVLRALGLAHLFHVYPGPGEELN